MNLLVVCHYFPPLNTVGAFRPWSWAKYWTRHGHRVTVLTTKKYPFDGAFDQTLRDEIDQMGVRVIEVPYLRRTNDVQKRSADSGPSKITVLKYLLRQVRRKMLGTTLDIRRLWVNPAVRAAVDAHGQEPFDAVISTFGPPACHQAAFRFKRLTGIPWIADYRDLWADHHYAGYWPFSTMARRTEDRLVAEADLITTTSEAWRKVLAGRFQVPTLTVENGFDKERMAAVSNCPFPRDGKKRIVYTGTLYTGDRDPTPLFAAINHLRSRIPDLHERLEVLFYGDLETLDAVVASHQVQDIVKVNGPVDLDTSLAMQKFADALLFVDWRERVKGFLTAKLFEYMNAGTPVLAIGGSPDLDASRLIQQTGTGLALGKDPERISEVLENLISDKHIPYDPDREFIDLYSREALAMRLLAAVSDTQP